MRKLTIAAAALLGAACFSGNAFALTGSYAGSAQVQSSAVQINYCHRGYGCYHRTYCVRRTCGCGCGCGGGFFGIF